MPQMKKNPVVAPGFADNFALNMDSSKGLGPWTAGYHQLPLLQTRLWVWSNGVLDRSCWKAKDSFIRRYWVGRNSSSIHSVYCISSSFRPESELGRRRCLFLLPSSAAAAAAAAAANNSSSSIILLCDMILSTFNEEVNDDRLVMYKLLVVAMGSCQTKSGSGKHEKNHLNDKIKLFSWISVQIFLI